MMLFFKDIITYIILNNSKLRNKYFIRTNEVYEKILKEYIYFNFIDYIRRYCIYGQYDSIFIEINKDIFTNPKICVKNNDIICDLSGDIYFYNLCIKRSDYKKMLKQLGVKI